MVAALVVIMALIVILILPAREDRDGEPSATTVPCASPNSRRTTKLSSASNRRSEW